MASLAGWNFETLRTGTLAGFVDSGLQRFPRLDIHPDTFVFSLPTGRGKLSGIVRDYA